MLRVLQAGEPISLGRARAGREMAIEARS